MFSLKRNFKTIQIISLLILLGFTTASFSKAKELANNKQFSKSKTAKRPSTIILDSDDITVILPHITDNSFLAFDIDYTLMAAQNEFGSAEWFNYLIDDDVAKGKTEIESNEKWYPVWMKAQAFNEIEMMDENLKNIFDKIEKENLPVIAISSRQPVCMDLTLQQLRKLKFAINKSPVSQHAFDFDAALPVAYRSGVLLTNNNGKGKIFLQWFLQNKHRLAKIKRIIFVDDILKNVESMAQAAKQLNLEFVGLRYSKGDKYKASLDRAKAKKQAKILLGNFDDGTMQILLKNLSKAEVVRE